VYANETAFGALFTGEMDFTAKEIEVCEIAG
jgi:hypothetical protein